MTNIVINIVFKLILNQATMRKDKSLYDSDLIKFDRKWMYTKHGLGSMDHPMDLLHGPGPSLIFKRKLPLLNAAFGSRKWEVRSRKSEVPPRLSYLTYGIVHNVFRSALFG